MLCLSLSTYNKKVNPEPLKNCILALVITHRSLIHFTLHLDNVIYCYDVLIWQHLKILKHPALLKHLWSYENSDEFCMVTEPIRPLESVIQTLDTTEIIAGLHNVVEALVFLHERVSLCSLWIRSVELNYC